MRTLKTKFKHFRLINGHIYYLGRLASQRNVKTETLALLPGYSLRTFVESINRNKFLADLRTRTIRALDVHVNAWKNFPYIHVVSGAILARQNSKRMERIVEDKRPTTPATYIGVEIECLINADMLALRMAMCKARLENFVVIKNDASISGDSSDDCDGSCRDNCTCGSCDGTCGDSDCEGFHEEFDCSCECTCSGYGVEIAVCSPESEAQGIIERVCAVLDEFDAHVNKTCGLHVHVDQRGKRAASFYKRLFENLPFLYSLVPMSRRNNRYCQLNQSDFDSHRALHDRYFAINTEALSKFRTLEIRLHSGTTNAAKINAWIRLILAIGRMKRFQRIDELKQLITLGVSTTDLAYWLARWRKFNTVEKKRNIVSVFWLPKDIPMIAEANDAHLTENSEVA